MQVVLPYTLQPKTPEDVNQLNANLNALVAGVNSVDSTQLASGAVTKAKLATDALNAFLKLMTAADRKLAFGGPYDDGASWGITPERTLAVPHGMGVTPVWAIAIATPAVSTASSADPVVCNLTGRDATNITFKLRTVMGGNCNFPQVFVYWAAIG